MVSIDGYRDFDICKYLISDTIDKKIFDQIIISFENIIVIKEFNSQEDVIEKWEDVMYFVAGHVQNKISKFKLDESYMWNIYIVYLVKEKVDKHLKLSIEKNKFCCKKYLIDSSIYKSQSEALINELPILADIDFEIKKDIYLKADKEIKKLICGNQINPIINYFIETDKIHMTETNSLIKDMVGLYYEYSKEN